MRYFHELIIAIILGIGLFIAGFYIGANSSFYFLQYKQRKAVQNLAKEMQKAREKEYQRLMADTYGGKTPQETLQMFISAVEKGDYELASRYFIFKKQNEELNSLKTAKRENIIQIINLLMKAKNRKDSSLENDFFQMEVKIENKKYPLVIDFVQYPNNVWKIEDF